jgi:hypothetical protein
MVTTKIPTRFLEDIKFSFDKFLRSAGDPADKDSHPCSKTDSPAARTNGRSVLHAAVLWGCDGEMTSSVPHRTEAARCFGMISKVLRRG